MQFAEESLFVAYSSECEFMTVMAAGRQAGMLLEQ